MELKIDFLTNAKFSKNRRFYDFFMRELVCAIYAPPECAEINPNLQLPYYHGRADWEYFRTVSDVFSEKEILKLNAVVAAIRKERKSTLSELKKQLLHYFPKLTDCHLDGINYMSCIK